MAKKTKNPIVQKDTINSSDKSRHIKSFQDRVRGDRHITDSYKKELINKADSIVSTFGSDLPIKPRHITQVVENTNQNRLKSFQETEGYKKSINNPVVSSTGIGRKVKAYEDLVKGKYSVDPKNYQIPSTSEMKSILKLGEKAGDSKTKSEALRKGNFTIIGALNEIEKIKKNYPKLDSIISKEQKRFKP